MKKSLLLIIALCMLLGVGALLVLDFNSDVDILNGKAMAAHQCGTNDVIAIVLGKKITKHDSDLAAMSLYKMATLNQVLKDGQSEKFLLQFKVRSSFEWPIREYIISKAREDYLPSDKEIETKLVQCQRQFGHKGENLKGFKKTLDEKGILLNIQSQLASELRFEHALNNVFSNEIAVTRVEYTNAVYNIDRYIAKVNATNALLYAVASNALRRIESGEDFAKVADECSQDPDKNPGGDLGELIPAELDSEPSQYQAAVLSLKEGEHTGILESLSGLEIVKLVEKVPSAKANSGEDSLHLARIFVRRAYLRDRPTEEQIWAELKEDKRIKFLSETAERAEKTGEIVYPQGREAFYKGK